MSKSRSSLFSIVPRIFIRLPLGFLVPFISLVAFWTLAVKPVLTLFGLRWPATEPLQIEWSLPNLDHSILRFVESIWSVSNLYHVGIAFVIIVVYVIGIIAIYNICVGINFLVVRQKLKLIPRPVARPYRPPPRPGLANPFENKSIGIVLAGGGAKGAFQAGAMKAIYRYLAERNALDNVKVIAGTSIGSWNALFWLADLIEAENPEQGPSALKSWWQSINLRYLVAPSWYAPALRNAFFDTAPWEQNFHALFLEQPEVANHLLQSKIHFYMVCHQVNIGTLACTTNNPDAQELLYSVTARVNPTILPPAVEPNAKAKATKFMKGLKDAVFASMDLPPLFPYVKIDRQFFEDGGVIDNLPIMFAAMEGCEVIFVLPLNADFTADPDHRSVINRFMRVMDVRQGALEQNNLKSVYLYNELAALRDHVRDLKRGGASTSAPQSKTLARALDRKHKELRIVAVCPQKTFVEETIDTQEFWKARSADFVFEIMENTTTEILSGELDLTNERIEIFEVDKYQRWRRNSNF